MQYTFISPLHISLNITDKTIEMELFFNHNYVAIATMKNGSFHLVSLLYSPCN